MSIGVMPLTRFSQRAMCCFAVTATTQQLVSSFEIVRAVKLVDVNSRIIFACSLGQVHWIQMGCFNCRLRNHRDNRL